MPIIRALEATDREVYLDMAAEFYMSEAVCHNVPQIYLERTFEEMMRSDVYAEGFIFLNEREETAGYAIVSKMFSQEAGGMSVWIEEIYIRQAYRGHGIGKAFFAFYEALHPEMMRLRLEVDKKNTDAIRLYKKLGFQAVSYYQMGKDKPH